MTEDEKRMTFTEHLAELRIRIIRSMVAIAVAVLLCYAVSKGLLNLLSKPLTEFPDSEIVKKLMGSISQEGNPAEHNVVKLYAMHPFEAFFLRLKVAGYGGLLLVFPYLLYQAGAFVFPGLKTNERYAVKVLVVGCSLLAVIGVLIAYFMVLPFVLPYISGLAPESWGQQLRASETLGIVVKLLAGFSMAFQFPMVVLILVYLDLLSPQTLKQYRRIAIVGMAVIAAMLTPPDPITMCFMLVPLLLLYEGSILLAHIVVRRRNRAEKAAE